VGRLPRAGGAGQVEFWRRLRLYTFQAPHCGRKLRGRRDVKIRPGARSAENGHRLQQRAARASTRDGLRIDTRIRCMTYACGAAGVAA